MSPSTKLTPAARTPTRTSPGPGSGSGASSSISRSGAPNSRQTMRRISSPSVSRRFLRDKMAPSGCAAPAPRVLLSVLLTLILDFLNIGSVSGTVQHPAQVDHRLGVDVLMRGGLEEFGPRPDSNCDHAIAVLHDRADRRQQRDHGMPLDVVAHGMLEDLAQRVAVVVVEVHGL